MTQVVKSSDLTKDCLSCTADTARYRCWRYQYVWMYDHHVGVIIADLYLVISEHIDRKPILNVFQDCPAMFQDEVERQ